MKYEYNRLKEQALSKANEPVTSVYDEANFENDADPDLQDAINAYGVVPANMKQDSAFQFDYDFGLDYDWSCPTIPIESKTEEAGSWLENQIRGAERTKQSGFQLPCNPHRADGKYVVGDLVEEQLNIAREVISTAKQWTEKKTCKYTYFVPATLSVCLILTKKNGSIIRALTSDNTWPGRYRKNNTNPYTRHSH
jgi:hypothetical protein